MKIPVGIDVSKRFHIAYTPLHKKPFRFDHNRTGFESLRQWLKEIAPGQEPSFGLEPTGPFTRSLADWLRQQGWEVMIVPGAYVKREKYYHTASSLKTDAVDAKVIASLVSQGRCKPYREHQEAIFELREITESYFRIGKTFVGIQNQVISLVDTVFPELSAMMDIKTLLARRLLTQYPDPRKLAEESPKHLSEFLWKASYRRFSPEQVIVLQEVARKTIGNPTGGACHELQLSVELLKRLADIQAHLIQQMECWLEQIPYAENLNTIPGFGTITTSMLLSQVGDLRDFPTARHLLKISGLNLIEHSSGTHQSKAHISHLGSPILRKYLFQAAVTFCCLPFGPLYPWFQEQSKTKPKKVLLVAAMRKLLRIAHAIARENVPFEKNRFSPTLMVPTRSEPTRAEDPRILSAGADA